MIDGLRDQNRALDGDTVIVELQPVSKWIEIDSSKLSIKQINESKVFTSNLIKALGYSNERPVEKRTVDDNSNANNSEEEQQTQLKEVTKEYNRHKSEDPVYFPPSQSNSDDEDYSGEDYVYGETPSVTKKRYKHEHGHTGAGFVDDE